MPVTIYRVGHTIERYKQYHWNSVQYRNTKHSWLNFYFLSGLWYHLHYISITNLMVSVNKMKTHS